MKRNTLIKVFATGAVLVALLTAAIPAFAAPADITESFVTNLQGTGNQAALASLQTSFISESAVTALSGDTSAYNAIVAAMNALQIGQNQGFYGFRAAMGSSMVNEPFISNLVATGQPTNMLGN